VFGVRLKEAFSCSLSLLKGERGYVTNALRNSMSAFVVPSPGKDPLLFICGFTNTPSNNPKITFLTPPTVIAMDLSLLPEESFVVLQSLNGPATANNPLFKEATEVGKFKDYKVLAYEKSERKKYIPIIQKAMKEGITTAMPKNAIITSAYFSQMISLKIKQESTPQSIAKDITTIEHVRGNFVQGKGCVRVLFDCPITEGIFAEVTSRYGDYCYMISSDDDVFNYTKKNPSRTIVVKRLDSCPITEQAANVLSSFLKMTRVTRKGGQVFGCVNDPSSLHEAIIQNVYSIIWLEAERNTRNAAAQSNAQAANV
jgi:hypothetical protein